MKPPRVIIVMGVSGSGKSTVGELLASRNHGQFFDADDFHPEENIRKMASGVPLDDHDRAPWLARLRKEVVEAAPDDLLTVLACSALKNSYRDQLGVGSDETALVYLEGSAELLQERLASRDNHYMKAGMLGSQLNTLEAPGPDEAIIIDIANEVERIVSEIETELDLGG